MAEKQFKERGNKLFSQGKYEAAIEAYSQAIVSLWQLRVRAMTQV